MTVPRAPFPHNESAADAAKPLFIQWPAYCIAESAADNGVRGTHIQKSKDKGVPIVQRHERTLSAFAAPMRLTYEASRLRKQR
ncbi:hypothetical protein AWB76_04545 [Caballeronia temeraria]|uniref:Uncharacterized protein n=1 Tax=Caballeronia temeraria TaxID=1777137 RepID=A0A158BRS2_9BURK|nr:hypothetical protein AWB76_04545 [Caballeronia temeraria]